MDSQPNLILALTGSTIIIPGVYGLYNRKIYGGLSSLILGLTSIVFHSTRNKTAEVVDKVAIANAVLSTYINVYINYSEPILAQLIFSSVFNSTVFFLGMKYNILCFDPDIRVQTFYHMLIHFFSAHTSYKVLSMDRIVNLLP